MSRSSPDAAYCRQIVSSHARTFALASWFLPPDKRRAAHALYAFCRVADDIVDLDSSRTDAAAALARMATQLDEALTGRPDGPLFRELAWTANRFGVPRAVLLELLGGVARDLEPARFQTTWALQQYCQGVASSVGEMCAHVFGVQPGQSFEESVRYARALGVAMQLTNILRDVGEDARRGRCYFPDEELAAYGIAREEVLAPAGLAGDSRWTRFAAMQVERAREWYECSLPGIALLSGDSQRCALACLLGYARILEAIEANGFDSFSHRASLAAAARARVLWQVALVPRRTIEGWHTGLAPAHVSRVAARRVGVA